MRNDHRADHGQTVEPPSSRRWVLVLLGFAAIAGALLFTEHRAHVLGALIYLPFLACPLMHLFMHHGHGGHGHDAAERQDRTTRSAS